MVPSERRKARRFDGHISIELKQGTGETCNCSTDGIYFLTDQTVSVGEQIEFFLLLTHSGLNPEVRLHCRGQVLRKESCSGKTGVASTLNISLLDNGCDFNDTVGDDIFCR